MDRSLVTLIPSATTTGNLLNGNTGYAYILILLSVGWTPVSFPTTP